MTTLTSLIEEVGTWDPAVLASACRGESRDVIISRMAAFLMLMLYQRCHPRKRRKYRQILLKPLMLWI